MYLNPRNPFNWVTYKKKNFVILFNFLQFSSFLSFKIDVKYGWVLCLTFQSRQAASIKSVTSFVKIFSSVVYKIFYFINSNKFLLHKTTVTTAHCLFVSWLSITDGIAGKPIMKYQCLATRRTEQLIK